MSADATPSAAAAAAAAAAAELDVDDIDSRPCYADGNGRFQADYDKAHAAGAAGAYGPRLGQLWHLTQLVYSRAQAAHDDGDLVRSDVAGYAFLSLCPRSDAPYVPPSDAPESVRLLWRRIYDPESPLSWDDVSWRGAQFVSLLETAMDDLVQYLKLKAAGTHEHKPQPQKQTLPRKPRSKLRVRRCVVLEEDTSSSDGEDAAPAAALAAAPAAPTCSWVSLGAADKVMRLVDHFGARTPHRFVEKMRQRIALRAHLSPNQERVLDDIAREQRVR